MNSQIKLWPPEETNFNYLLSYPSSGNHWVRFIIEWFSGRPTIGCMEAAGKDTPICKNSIDGNPLSHVDINLYPIAFKSHEPEKIIDNGKNKLITLVRNYKECIASRSDKESLKSNGLNVKEIDRYIKIITTHQNFRHDKLLIYYEDLIDKPKKTISDLTKFLNIYSNRDAIIFHKNHDLFCRSSLSAKGRWWKEPTSNRKQIYHSRILNKSQLIDSDSYISCRHGSSVSVLERYLEK